MCVTFPNELCKTGSDDCRNSNSKFVLESPLYTPERYPEALVRFMKGPGRRKVLLGSNFPMIQPAKCVAQLDSLGLSDEVRRLFLWENAVETFRRFAVAESAVSG